MNRWLFAAILGLIAAMAATAEAGIFCRSCRSYSCSHAVHVTKVVKPYVSPPQANNVTNIIFSNQYPAAAPGLTGYQAYAAPYQPSAATFASLSSEALKIAGQNSAIGQGQAQVEAGLEALRLQTQQVLAVTQHLQAGLRGAAGGGSQTLILQIGADGTVKQVTPQQVGAEQVQQPQTASVIADRCAKCHSGNQPKGEFYLDGQSAVDDASFRLALEAVATGAMPPKSEPALSGEEKAAIMDELLRLKPSP